VKNRDRSKSPTSSEPREHDRKDKDMERQPMPPQPDQGHPDQGQRDRRGMEQPAHGRPEPRPSHQPGQGRPEHHESQARMPEPMDRRPGSPRERSDEETIGRPVQLGDERIVDDLDEPEAPTKGEPHHERHPAR